ncbi:hypothetical protein SK803_23425 [Lentzea sp. BCCO 10_0856]|uniref:DUF5666 domain-containing protein n=1 Tax=Lentzea miocenica TaxID=3095431 RepID=A0ABU4T4U8_9PSEU|nr:hypothetical protein [Lentzea sp. BCCO 10_0856]MDX8033179.1 hypothetical protein [Lentzea sp. BCCO 10_0856]
MTEQQPPEWGAPAPAPQPAARPAWTAKKTVAAVAIAVGIAAAGGVAIYAVSGTNQQTGTMGGPGGMGGAPDGNGMRQGGPGFGLGSGSATHGEFQTGEVTSISDTSVEVKSTDGYTKTYVIDADTVAEGVEKGDTVTVIATTEDGKSVASSVVEPGQRGQQGQQAPPTR